MIFTFLYKFYLNQFEVESNEVDAITEFVAHQTENTLQFFGKDCKVVKHDTQASYKVIYYNSYLARIIEGCNAISVIILFASFVFAFSSNFKTTFLFILFGSVLVFILNIFRIALLTVGLYYYPEYEEFFHNIVFPLVIYGVVFILWIVWVIKFSAYAKRN